MKHYKKPAIAILLTSLFLVTGCAAQEPAAKEPTGADKPLTKASLVLSFPRGIAWGPVEVAEQLGYYKDEGLDLEFSIAQGSGAVGQQLSSGQIKMGALSSPPLTVAFGKLDQLRAAYCVHTKGLFSFVALDGSEIKDLADLKGKVLGISSPSGGEVPVLSAALEEAGLVVNQDVRTKAIGHAGPQSLKAIQTGDVDAYAAGFPDIVALTAAGLNLRDFTPAAYQAIPGACLVATKSEFESPATEKILAGVSRAWAKASVFMLSNPDAGYAVLCKAVPQECKDEKVASILYKKTLSLMTPGGVNKVGFVNGSAWQILANSLQKAGTISSVDVKMLASDPALEKYRADVLDFDHKKIEKSAKEWTASK